MDFLKRQNYNVVPLSDIVDWLSGMGTLPEKAIALAFDDNYIGNYQYAFPILVDRELYATYFVHTGYVGVMTSKDHSDWTELQEMEDSGFIDVESHTVTHPDLTSLSLSELQYELTQSKADIESNLTSKICKYIAYPMGKYNSTVIDECVSAGYEAGFRADGGVNTGSEPLFEIKRVFCVNDTTLASFKSLIGFSGSDQNGPIIIDNTSGEFTTSGTWDTSTQILQKYGTNYHYATTSTTPSAYAYFTPNIQQAGSYNIYVWWTAHTQRPDFAEYQINHSGGTNTVYKDQTVNGGRWNLLGTYTLSAGTSNYVRVSNIGTAGNYVIADAVKFEPTTSDVQNWNLY